MLKKKVLKDTDVPTYYSREICYATLVNFTEQQQRNLVAGTFYIAFPFMLMHDKLGPIFCCNKSQERIKLFLPEKPSEELTMISNFLQSKFSKFPGAVSPVHDPYLRNVDLGHPYMLLVVMQHAPCGVSVTRSAVEVVAFRVDNLVTSVPYMFTNYPADELGRMRPLNFYSETLRIDQLNKHIKEWSQTLPIYCTDPKLLFDVLMQKDTRREGWHVEHMNMFGKTSARYVPNYDGSQFQIHKDFDSLPVVYFLDFAPFSEMLQHYWEMIPRKYSHSLVYQQNFGGTIVLASCLLIHLQLHRMLATLNILKDEINDEGDWRWTDKSKAILCDLMPLDVLVGRSGKHWSVKNFPDDWDPDARTSMGQCLQLCNLGAKATSLNT